MNTYDYALNFTPMDLNNTEVEKILNKHKDCYSLYKIAPTEILLRSVPLNKRAEIIKPILKLIEKEKTPIILRCLKRG